MDFPVWPRVRWASIIHRIFCSTGMFPVESAGLGSLVFHTFWGARGTHWAARQFGASEIGAALAGFTWATCGFFLIHLPHQWGYTVGVLDALGLGAGLADQPRGRDPANSTDPGGRAGRCKSYQAISNWLS